MPATRRDPWILSALGLLLAGLWFQIRYLAQSWQAGGHVWLQGDWLISLAAGPVRRGPFGEGLLRLSDALSLSPLALLIGLQALLVALIFAGVARLVAVQGRGVLAMVLFTPGIFAVVWAIDPISALRKEMIALLALIWLAQPGGGLRRLALTGALMLVGGLGHEITILLLPAWAITASLLHPHLIRRPAALAVIGVVFLLGGAELFYALRYMRLEDAGPLCAALTQRGLSAEALCGGAIAWLADPQNGSAKVWLAMQRSWTVWLHPLAWALAAAPLWRVWRSHRPAQPRSGLLILLAVAPICLLYPVGLDWGRWFAVQITVAAVIMLGLAQRGVLAERAQIKPAERALWLLSAVSWGFWHSPILTKQGLLARLFG